MESSLVSEGTSVYDVAYRHSLSQTHMTILSRVAPGATVLEIGPSSGYLTKVLVDRGCTVDAIELNPRDAEKARPFCRKITVGSAEDTASFSQLDGPYDVAIMADVLEHLRAPELTLAEVHRRLTPRGEALVSLPNIAHWKMRLDLLRGKFEYQDSGLLDRTHLRFFTVSTATEFLRAAGFRIEEVIVPPPNHPRFGPAKGWLKSGWPSMFALQVVYRLSRAPNCESTTVPG